MLLVIVWVLLLAGTIVADISYKRAMRESALRNSGLSSMSSIYSVINFIDLKTNTLIPVYADEKTQEVLPQGEGAKEKLLDIFGRDTTAPYRAAVLEFVNTDTLAERLRNGSIALEYVSKAYGWSQVRFFPVDPDEGKPLERALLTIQDINDEKQKIERFEQHSAQVELESNMRSIVVSGLSNGMSSSVGIIDDLAAKIASESDDESVCKDANHIRDHAKALTYLIDATMDSTARSSEDLKSKPEGYVLSDMIADACAVVGTVVTNKELTFDIEVSPSIPKRLIGDKRRIERALIGLLSYATRPESVTTAKLSAYGAEHDGKEHVLFSVKTDGKGLNDKDAHTVSVFLSDLEQYDAHAIDAGHEELESVALLLLHMESELKIVNDPGEELELYFEIEQQIPNSPVDGSNDEA